jgi:class 3 adenylate cyclase
MTASTEVASSSVPGVARYLVGNGYEVVREMEHLTKHVDRLPSCSPWNRRQHVTQDAAAHSVVRSPSAFGSPGVTLVRDARIYERRSAVRRSHNSARAGNLSRVTESLGSLPLPEDPTLAAWASVLNEAGYWAIVLDAGWRFVFFTDELLLTYGYVGASAAVLVGSHFFSAESSRFRGAGFSNRAAFLSMGRYMLTTTPGGHEELRQVVDPVLADLVDELQPEEVPIAWMARPEWTTAGADAAYAAVWLRIDGGDGQLAGFCVLIKPAAGMSDLGLAAVADLAHLARMHGVERPHRRPAAILMADLEASSPLARHLSTAQYFAFGRRFVRTADQCIIDAGGIVGRHAGDGVVAYFLAETAGSESAAARACVTAARALRDTLPDIAARSDIADADLSLRFGLHWGATLYIGRILSGGRSEVTALGDEANEAARIEACATGARTLASKSLIERLSGTDADALGIDTTHTTYTRLADLATATDKARRDAPSIAVCEV